MAGGATALIIAASDPDSFQLCKMMIEDGVNLNKVTDNGQSALSESVQGNNRALTELLLKFGAKIFYEEAHYRDNSPFFKAISLSSIWAIELFCDHGADVNTTSASG